MALNGKTISVVSDFLSDDTGAAAIEYGVIAMAMFLAIIPSFLYVSGGISIKFSSIAGYFSSFN